jgi:monothiol glutaredoxin
MSDDVQQKIEKWVKENKVFLFMKGTPEQPQCGFSYQVIQILKTYERPYQTFDVLSDESIREGVKKYSDWPTIPQLYVDGEFIGGCDIATQQYENGELKTKVEKAFKESP